MFRHSMILVPWIVATGICACGAEKSPSGPGYDVGVDATQDTGLDADGLWDSLSDTPWDTGTDPTFEPATDTEEEPCVAEEMQAELGVAPVDIIWVVDSSGSMDYEMHTVRDNLNDFSYQITVAGIDHHVILIGDASEMAVPPPLGGGPNFMHIDDSVDSHEALSKLLEHYPTYASFLRPGAIRHFVVVSDDESDLSSSDFLSTVGTLTDPGFPPTTVQPYGFSFHSIVAFGSIPIIGCVTGAGIGRQYLNLSDLTWGVKEQICQTDWSPIFDALETAIGVVTVLPCIYDIPDPPDGMTLEPDEVNLQFTPTGGAPSTIPRVDDPTLCPEYGWYYDDPADPERILLCPTTCSIVQADAGANMSVAFGCATVII